MSDTEFDFSDASNNKIDTKSIRFMECKKGTYKMSPGDTEYSLYDSKALAKLDKDIGNQSPCRCEVCMRRAKFDTSKVPPGTSRSGMKRTFEAKYGEGRTLGEPPLKKQRGGKADGEA